MIRVRRRPRLVGALVALALALAPALPSGMGAQAASSAPTKGYWFVAGDGGIFSFGDASFAGSTGSLKLNQPIVGMAPTPTGRGYWFVAADGGIFSFGDAKFFGSTGSLKLNRPIVGMAPTPTGRGYWFVAADGGIFSFGDAAFYGSTGSLKLAKPIVGMAASPTGRGYWFVASDGGIFTYGDAGFFGSAAGGSVRSPIVSIAATPSGKGYFLAAADGTVRAFGDAVFKGSMGGKALASPIVGLGLSSTGAGYWLVAADGGIFSFGDAGFYGSTGSIRLNRAIVGMAAAPQKTAALPGGTGGTGGTTPGGGTAPGGGGTTGTTTPGGGTTDTTLPPANGVNWGAAGATTVVPKASSGGGNAFRPWMSEDGRYLVFDSDGKRLMNGTVDPVGIRDIYLYDRTLASGAFERISIGVGGARAHIPEADQTTGACPAAQRNPCGSQRPTISRDGRFVAFWSSADNLVPGDTNGHTDAFLRDRQTGTTTLVSKGFGGAQADGDSKRPVVSRDGAYVAFESAAANLISPATCPVLDLSCRKLDTNNADDVFLYEVATGSLTRVSAAVDGSQSGAADRPTLSANGRRIAYQSGGSVFLRDLASGQTTLVAPGESPSLSADGRWISFDSKGSLNSVDSGGDLDVYVKDLENGTVEQVSLKTDGSQATGTFVGADSTISSDGRFVAFWSDSSNLAPNDSNGVSDVFVRDRVLKTTTRVTSTNGTQGDNDSFSPALSMDGRFVAFDSKATTLDTSGGSATLQDIFVHVNY